MRLIACIFILLSSIAVLAVGQDLELGVELGPQIPFGDFAKGQHVKVGWGCGSVLFHPILLDKSAIAINLHYSELGSTDMRDNSFNALFLLAGYRYDFLNYYPFHEFLLAEIGFYLANTLSDTGISHNAIAMGIALTTGVRYSFSKKIAFSFSAKTHFILNSSMPNFYGINIGAIRFF